MVNIICPSRYKINRAAVRSYTDQYLKKLGIPPQYILNIIFVGRVKMKSIAAKYKHASQALPVLSFPYNQEKDRLLGEIFICYPQAVLLAAERNRKVDHIISFLIKHAINNLIN